MPDLFHFPTFDEQYPNLRERGLRKYAVVYLRDKIQRLLARRQCNQFTEFINRHPMWAPIFQRNPYVARSVLDTYADKRFGKAERLQALVDNFTLAETKPSAEKWQEWVSQRTVVFNRPTADLYISLSVDPRDPLEGFFLVSLQSTERSRIYDAVFSFVAPNGLLITSIQGPHSEDAPELIRHTTKQLHGVRPMFMMVNVFKLMAAELGCELYGIPHKSQAKFRWNDSSRLLFNYDAFWQENQGRLDANGYWRLPAQIERTPLEDIQSKKRSMYRKRYEMLDTLEQDIRRFFRS
ncbi:DUF535 domain-containing protein [Eikenella sp. S3360]|uniref:DUF535 domain-containing protein n=1 Tax=Eikenella glucosivorans TaxID=2766967 RepID=A0ABS0NB61_9NEIS|nr:DUF535 family protein [Eikenella glucosivorans]MBH5329484.1 DUF535 domain-containing protein [Eikenella glucosivorans]